MFDLYCSLRDTLIIKQMGECSEESVKKAVKEVLSAERRIDVLCSLNGVKLESISKGSFVLNIEMAMKSPHITASITTFANAIRTTDGNIDYLDITLDSTVF